jgi:hypothetical protein
MGFDVGGNETTEVGPPPETVARLLPLTVSQVDVNRNVQKD